MSSKYQTLRDALKAMAIVTAALLLGGCDDLGIKPNPDGTGMGAGSTVCDVRVVRGHEYLIFSVRQGCSALHAASCPCMEGGEHEEADAE